ncbi:hypothetical protein SDC9_142515 [bioreactor metagenome]|uniref:Uncharacterized protein n=1 Tax=bioreactor metagenome TaxID=1076179 RepID=A0A645E1D1_9ZZZZ
MRGFFSIRVAAHLCFSDHHTRYLQKRSLQSCVNFGQCFDWNINLRCHPRGGQRVFNLFGGNPQEPGGCGQIDSPGICAYFSWNKADRGGRTWSCQHIAVLVQNASPICRSCGDTDFVGFAESGQNDRGIPDKPVFSEKAVLPQPHITRIGKHTGHCFHSQVIIGLLLF